MVGMEMLCGDFLGDRRRDQFQHNGKRARVGQRLGVGEQRLMFGLVLPLM